MLNKGKKVRERWTSEQACNWYKSKSWLCGFNYLPSTAVNSTEMWQQETFDIETIEREMGWAEEYGYNSCRVFLQYIIWRKDSEGYKKRIDRFLEAANMHNITTILILFDDCAFAHKEPYYGKQDDPIHGIHNSGWTPSPGPTIADDKCNHASIEAYVKDILNAFSNDDRVLMWDLYNEPGNSERGVKSLWLLKASFQWARETKASQPFTSGAWGCEATDEACVNLSDVITFHCYVDYEKTKARINSLKEEGYPLINTEWMARHFDCCIETHLLLYKEQGIGCYQWGLVQGKTQTYFPWGSKAGAPEPEIWFHDVLKPDGAPYNASEMILVKKLTGHGKELRLTPVDMTVEVMQALEEMGLIYRLCPDRHVQNPAIGETIGSTIYQCSEKYGSHMLITVSVNRSEFAGFGTHPDNEDFLLIGESDVKPMYLVIAKCMRNELEKKITNHTLSADDFVALKVKYNDPQVSFFTMLKDVPHGEAVADKPGRFPSFYVTEPANLPLDITNFHDYRITVI